MRIICISDVRVGIEREIRGQCDCGAEVFEYVQIKTILIVDFETVLN